MSKLPIGRLTVFLVFALSRLQVVSTEQRESTLAEVNVRYAVEAQRAANLGKSFYQLHAENRGIEEPSSLPTERVVEYPPLAILWMQAPTWFLPPAPVAGPVPDTYVAAAKTANRVAMLLVDLCGFGLLVMAGATAVQLAVYMVGGQLLFTLLYDRFDLLLGVLLLGAIVLLVRRWPYWASLIVLAAAINFKVTPLVLVPLFVLGTLPVDAFSSSTSRLWGLILKRTLILAAGGAVMFLPFFIRDGFATLAFFKYHSLRGLEIESVWNTLPLALVALFSSPASTSLRFGAVEMKSALSGPLRTSASIFTAAVIPVLAVMLWRMLSRLKHAAKPDGAVTLAQANPDLFLRCAVVCLLTAVAGAHVLSPQYLLWFVPLIALWRGPRETWVWCGFLAICVLTTINFPFMFNRMIHVMRAPWEVPVWARLLWPAPLIARNVLLAGFAAWLWMQTFRKPA